MANKINRYVCLSVKKDSIQKMDNENDNDKETKEPTAQLSYEKINSTDDKDNVGETPHDNLCLK